MKKNLTVASLLKSYKKWFEENNCSQKYELTKNFLKVYCELFLTIQKLEEECKDIPRLIFHPKNKSICKEPECFQIIDKKRQLFKDMTLTLNKIVGVQEAEEEDPIAKWLEEQKNKK